MVENSNAISKALLLEKNQEKNNLAPRKNSYEIFWKRSDILWGSQAKKES